jgi:hypothetical protein
MVTRLTSFVILYSSTRKRESSWDWPERRPKHVDENFVYKIHNYWNAFDGHLYILDQINAR